MQDFSNLFSLAGKRALVTGGSKGIGFAAAQALSAWGADVTIASRNKAENEAAVAEIIGAGNKAVSLILDVSDVNAVRSALARLPAFDILVNSAGTNKPGPFIEVEPDSYDQVTDLNVRSAFFVAQAVARKLVAEVKPGSLINISSQMGHVGAVHRSIYCTSKFAIEGMTKALAVELASHGIRVNSICPTFIETPMTEPFLANEVFKQSVLSKIKLGRLGQVNDLVGAILLLARGAGGLMTGSSIVIDGGWTAE